MPIGKLWGKILQTHVKPIVNYTLNSAFPQSGASLPYIAEMEHHLKSKTLTNNFHEY